MRHVDHGPQKCHSFVHGGAAFGGEGVLVQRDVEQAAGAT